MFIEEQSRANIAIENSYVYYDVGSPLPAAVTIYSSEGLSGQFYDPTSNPVYPIGGFAQKIDDGSGTIYEDWTEQTLTHLCDIVPITWTLTINITDLNTYTTTTRTDVVTLSSTPVTYTLRCTAVNQLCEVASISTSIPV
jgi:hypothetical protein